MNKYFFLGSLMVFIYGCSGASADKEKQDKIDSAKTAYDAIKGVGKFTHVDLGPALNHALADGGKSIYSLKCSGCHKLTGEKLVGPGWKGVTERRHPEWIMNFVTNTEEMLNKDTSAQAMLEICMVKMPNQNLTDEDARKMLEFMRQNDGVK